MNLTPLGSIPVPSIRMRASVSGTRLMQTVTFTEMLSAVGWMSRCLRAPACIRSAGIPPSGGQDPCQPDDEMRLQRRPQNSETDRGDAAPDEGVRKLRSHVVDVVGGGRHGGNDGRVTDGRTVVSEDAP